jgi:hypothetical protein
MHRSLSLMTQISMSFKTSTHRPFSVAVLSHESIPAAEAPDAILSTHRKMYSRFYHILIEARPPWSTVTPLTSKYVHPVFSRLLCGEEQKRTKDTWIPYIQCCISLKSSHRALSDDSSNIEATRVVCEI